MFCHQCGTCLEEEMQFCPSCGARVITKNVVERSSDISLPVPKDTFTIAVLGEEVSFNENIDYYVKLRAIFEELSDELAEEFSGSFYVNYKDMDHFVQKFPNDFQRIFKHAISTMNEILSAEEIFGVPQEELAPYMEKYCYHTYLELEEIMEQYQVIVERQEDMKRYREARKDSRGRVIGGGFGFQGAVKGMATAGAINMTTGVLHSVGNALGNMGSAINALNEKDKLFRSGIASCLANAIEKDILGVHLVVVDMISSRLGIQLCKFPEENKRQADKIFDDLDKALVPDHKKRIAVIRMLATYPFEPSYYQMAVSLFPNEIEKLRDFADFFNFDIDEFYSDLILRVNPAVEILLEYQDEVEDLSTDITELMEYFEEIFDEAKEKGFFFLPEETEKGRKRLNGARSSYAKYNNEIPLVLYDATLGNSGKDGFLVTNKHVYIKTTGKPIRLLLSDAIKDICQEDKSNGCTYLCFGEYNVHLLNAGDMVHEDELEDYMEQIIASIIFLTMLKPHEQYLGEAILQYRRLPVPSVCIPAQEMSEQIESQSRVCYCFECGAQNTVGDRFCFECGAELV